MMLLHFFDPTILTQVPCSRGAGVMYKFVKRSTVPGVNSGLYLRANSYGASEESDTLHDNQLKNYHPISAPFLSLYSMEL